MPSFILAIDVLIVMLLVNIVSVIRHDAPAIILAIPLIPLGVIFCIWLKRKIEDILDD